MPGVAPATAPVLRGGLTARSSHEKHQKGNNTKALCVNRANVQAPKEINEQCKAVPQHWATRSVSEFATQRGSDSRV